MGHVTITTNPAREQTVIGAGGATTTSIGFEFFEANGSDVDVYVDAILKTDPSDYSIAPTAGTEGGFAGGTITWTSTQTSVTVTTELSLDLARSSDFPVSGAFNITTLNTQLDKLWAALKQLESKVDRKSGIITTDTLNAAADIDWPAKAIRSGQFAKWDANGKLDVASAITTATTTTYSESLLDDTTAAAARITLDFTKGADIASAASLTLGSDGNYFDVTGTVTVTSIVTWNVGDAVRLHFDGAVTLTHHATNLILPGGANITTAAGDEFTFVEYAAGTWRCVAYALAAGTAIAGVSLSTSQAWTNQQYFTPVTNDSSSGGAITFDFTAHGNYIEFTLTENLTSITLTGLNAGGVYKIRLKQHASSAKTVTGWPGAVEWRDATEGVMNTTVSKYSLVTIEAGTTDHMTSMASHS